jgi:multimeric flavodoxin WrbA
MRIVILGASPRRDGNSWALADALARGAGEAGHDTELVDLNAAVGAFLRDCRRCRRPDGTCGVEDGYAALLHDRVLPADGLVYATPLYWYGVAGVLKTFFDRLFCYMSPSFPRAGEVNGSLPGKRSALLLSSEERYPTAAAAVVAQLQETARYLEHQFVDVVHGVGNARAEVRWDPQRPLDAAAALGRELFDRHHSDYRWSTDRPRRVWTAPPASTPPPSARVGD